MDSLKLFVVRNIACRIYDSEELPKRPRTILWKGKYSYERFNLAKVLNIRNGGRISNLGLWLNSNGNWHFHCSCKFKYTKKLQMEK